MSHADLVECLGWFLAGAGLMVAVIAVVEWLSGR